jgi:NAD-dependent DNA ligase
MKRWVVTDNQFYNRIGNERISTRQVDELIGLAHGLSADGVLNQAEIEFLQKWLAANHSVSGQPLLATLFRRVNEILSDGVAEPEECKDLLAALSELSSGNFELGEALKSTTLPLCSPPPKLVIAEQHYCFTGTFSFGRRQACEAAVVERGGTCGSLTRKTDILVIGVYATDSWLHSAFGHKIMKACEMRDSGVPISIVSEEHWAEFL